MDNFVLSDRPTVRQLEYATTVARVRHFSKAAAACGVSQPALSAQLLALERTLGITLFERSRSGVLLTQEGSQLLPIMSRVLDDLDRLGALARATRDPLAGDVRLGVIPTVAPYFLPHAMPAVRKTYPRLRLLLLEEKTETLIARLRSGDIEAAILALPTREDGFVERELFVEPFVVALRRDDPLAKKKALKSSDLAESHVLLLADGHCLRDQALSVCERIGTEVVEGLSATSLPTLVQMVASGIGTTLLPQLAADVLIRGNELVSRPFHHKAPGRTVGLVWRKNASRSVTLRRIAEVLAESGVRALARS